MRAVRFWLIPGDGENAIETRRDLTTIPERANQGDPIVHKYPDSAVAKAYPALAGTVAEQIAKITPPPELPGLKL